MEPVKFDDEALLTALRDAWASAHHDQYDAIVARGQEAFLFAALEAEFADLVYDSLLDEAAVGAMRASGQPRIAVFESDGLSLEVEVVGDSVAGQLAPPMEASVVMEGADGQRSTCRTDTVGCFLLAAPAATPVRFHVSAGAKTITTEWLS